MSNLPFILTGLYILYRGKTSKLAKIFAFTAITIGLLSFIYDSSYTYISQLFDLTGMFLFVNTLIYLNFKAILKSSRYLLLSQVLVYALSMVAIITLRGHTGNVVFGLYILGVVVTEYLLYGSKKHTNYKYWLLALGVFLLGFVIWLFDATRTFCFSFGLLNGRAIFHYLDALAIYYLYVFYELNEK